MTYRKIGKRRHGSHLHSERPNLNILGKRQPHIYGHETLADVEADCRIALEFGQDIRFHQSNREYEIINWVHEARGDAAGIVINPAAFTHTSVAILDALNAFEPPVIESISRTCTSGKPFGIILSFPIAPMASSLVWEPKAISLLSGGSPA